MMHGAGSGVPSMAYYSYSNQASPAIETSSKENPFEGFPTVTIPPRLKNIGRKISQMSNDFLDETDNLKTTSTATSPNLETNKEIEVPGMGDEPVMCPFCNKPLPPSLLSSQLTSTTGKHNHNNQHNHNQQRPSNLRRASSMRTSTSPSPRMTPTAPLSRVPSANTPPLSRKQSLLDPLPVITPESKIIEPDLPSATSESFAETVKEGDVANHDAAEKMITNDELKRWSNLSGIALQLTPSTTNDNTPIAPSTSKFDSDPTDKPVEEKKAFPLLPPPPPAASKLTKPPPSDRPSSASSSKFGFFGSAKKDDNEDEESDDDNVATGYTQLTGPASDSEDEESTTKKQEKKKLEGQKQEEKVEAKKDDLIEEKPKDIPAGVATDSEVPEEKDSAVEESNADPDEIKKVLQEVLGRVNDLSKSQSALLASHSTLLTSLKIARSNLAMAEANSEMLEAQLKRTSATSASATSRTGTSTRNVSGPTTTPGTPQPQLAAPAPRASADHVRATTTTNTTATPASAIRTPARASMEERPRPTSLYITANELASAGGAPAPSSAGGSNSSSSNSWGFWNGGKKKVTGALSHVHIPSATNMIDAFQPPTRPGTPNPDGSHTRKSTDSISNWIPTSPAAPYSVPVSSLPSSGSRPQPNRTFTHHANLSKSYNEQPSLSRSMSVMNVSGQRSVSTSATSASVSNEELSKLRQAYSAAVAKMDGMSKELAELKKGKVEMETELENLSQALFEEANKMVSDERRKRSELEEALKEVKDEREALKSTIKVLGGKVDDSSTPNTENNDDKHIKIKVKDTDEDKGKEEDEEEEEDFKPRDLDKHYAALRKSIHHVAIGVDVSSDNEDDEEEEDPRRKSIPIVTEPISFSPTLGLSIPSTSSTRPIDNSVLSSSQESDSFANQQVLSMSMPSLPAPLPIPVENNPWANTNTLISTSPIINYSPPRINVKAATPSPHFPPAGLPELPNDQAGEGEAPTGLGLDLDKGLVEGEGEENEKKKQGE